MTPPAGSFWKTVGAFVLIGPYVGGFIFAIEMLVGRFGGLGTVGPWDIVSLPVLALTGYMFGTFPAFLTGAICGAISGRIGSKVLWVILATAIGWFFATVAFGGISDSWKFFGPLGAAGAFVASIVALQVRPRWKN